MQPIVEEIECRFPVSQIFESFVDMPHSFYLDSGMDPYKLGRYSFIGAAPFLVFRCRGEEIEVVQEGQLSKIRGNPLEVLRVLLNQYKVEGDSLPLAGGAVGYFGYELGRFVEEVPTPRVNDLDLPDCYLGFYDVVLWVDHLMDKVYLVGLNDSQATKERLGWFKSRLAEVGRAGLVDSMGGGELELVRVTSNFSKEAYLGAIERAKEYIAAGDIYQVNLSQRLASTLYMTPWELYKRLRALNPAPFAAYLNFDDLVVVSASPERFLKVNGRIIETRPIKGTRPRGRDSGEDEVLAAELLESEKDKAEHVMIVDLERNDLGKLCEYGSVWVKEFEILETYATVFHLVSTVEGTLLPGTDWIDCLKATFPGGSITGAPKVRAMEIIAELEPTWRSVYTGSIGYLSFNGNLDLSIVIRTFIVKGRCGYFQVGGGIVADSSPELEYQETLDKAKALIQALYTPLGVKVNPIKVELMG